MAPQDPPEVDRWTGNQRRKRSVEENNGGGAVWRKENAGEKKQTIIFPPHPDRGFHVLLFMRKVQNHQADGETEAVRSR